MRAGRHLDRTDSRRGNHRAIRGLKRSHRSADPLNDRFDRARRGRSSNEMKYEYEGPEVKPRASPARASGCYILKFRGNYEREDSRRERLSFALYALVRFNDARVDLITDLNYVSSNHWKWGISDCPHICVTSWKIAVKMLRIIRLQWDDYNFNCIIL